ncbi:SPRY domain [Phytophthora cactorum]|nr:SPRY domain [Phytophthora cactorum]
MIQSRASLAPPISSFPPANIFYDSESDDSDSDVEELFDAGDFVTVDEDLLLVKLRCFHPKLDVSGLSSAFQREFGVQRDPQELESRLQKLQTPEFQALFILYLKALTSAKDSANSGSGILPEYQSLLESTRTLCETQLFQMMYDLDKNQHEAARSWLSSRGRNNGPKPGFHSVRCPNSERKLLVTDIVPRYDSCAVFNHFEQTIFDRLVLFAKDPTVVERLALQRQQQVEANRIKQQFSHQLRAIFETLRVKQAEKLEQMQLLEFETIKSQLEKNLEADLQHIRQMHAALLNHEQAKIYAKYQEQKTVLNEKVKCMQRDVMTLQKKCDSSGWHGLERMIMNTSLQVERIFGSSEYLLRLLILAEDIEADSLRRALVKYISEPDKLPQFALRRELTSKMIAETTVLAILKESTTKNLLEVANYGADFLHQDFVSRELHTRKVEFGRFLAGLTNDRLRAARRYTLAKKLTSSGVTTLHDNPADVVNEDFLILDEEFDRFASALEDFLRFCRKNSHAVVNSQLCGRRLRVATGASHRYCTVHATKERRQGESGKWMFEVTVDVFGGDGESLLIGWEVPRHSTSSTTVATSLNNPHSSSGNKDHVDVDSSSMVPGISPSDDGRSFGVTWQSDGGLDMGMLHANGVSKSGVPSFRAGDFIGCTIDQDVAVPQLRFYLNGDLTLPLRRTTNSGGVAGLLRSDTCDTPSTFGIAVTNPAYRLVPVVSMYSSSKKPQMRVTFNFRGDFKFPILGFDPFGAPL